MAGETAGMKGALAGGEKAQAVGDHDWPRDANGQPMVKIACAAAELVPTVQYGNVTVGPVQVTRFVPDGEPDHIKAWIRHVQELCEQAVSEDRQSVHDLMRSRAAV